MKGIYPILLFLMSFQTSAAVITKQTLESYCMTGQDESISWGLAFDYTESPVVLELKFTVKKMIDTKLITLDNVVLPFTERVTASSKSTKILHEYAIGVEDSAMANLLTDSVLIVLHNSDGHKMLSISDDFISCIKLQLNK